VKKKASPGQKSLWEEWETPDEEIRKVAEKFVLANCYDPKVASLRFE
jgi:putative transposase